MNLGTPLKPGVTIPATQPITEPAPAAKPKREPAPAAPAKVDALA